jgi:hypothetical protein
MTVTRSSLERQRRVRLIGALESPVNIHRKRASNRLKGAEHRSSSLARMDPLLVANVRGCMTGRSRSRHNVACGATAQLGNSPESSATVFADTEPSYDLIAVLDRDTARRRAIILEG